MPICLWHCGSVDVRVNSILILFLFVCLLFRDQRHSPVFSLCSSIEGCIAARSASANVVRLHLSSRGRRSFHVGRWQTGEVRFRLVLGIASVAYSPREQVSSVVGFDLYFLRHSLAVCQICASPVTTGNGDDLWRVYDPDILQSTQAHSAWPSLCGWVHWVLSMVLSTFGEETNWIATWTAGIYWLKLVTTGNGDNLWRVYHPDIFHQGPLSLVDKCIEYCRWFRPLLGKKQRVWTVVGPATWTAGILAEVVQRCWLLIWSGQHGLHASLIGCNHAGFKVINGMSFLATDFTVYA